MAADGRRYLDFASGIAVTALGHAHPHLVAALTEQAQKVWHTSNLFRIPGQQRLAERLVAASFADSVFFTNSGAEAIECAIKLVRKYHDDNGHPERYRVITCEGGFHGRTLATLAAGGQEKHLEGFGPGGRRLRPGAVRRPQRAARRDPPDTAAILVEPVQGEGGMRAGRPTICAACAPSADEFGLLLVFDEVQCGMGRTGKLFAHEWAGVTPDVHGLAKGSAAASRWAPAWRPTRPRRRMTAGSHGSTFGGNPLAMAVGNAVLDVMLADGFFAHVEQHGRPAAPAARRTGAALSGRSSPRSAASACCSACAAWCRMATSSQRLRERGLLTAPAGDNVVRVLPPLIIDESQIDEAMAIIDAACAAWPARHRLRRWAARAAPSLRHFLDLDRIERPTLRRILDDGRASSRRPRRRPQPLAGKTLAMIFEKPSTRTRVSFEVAMRQLGGDVDLLERDGSQLGRGETVADTARVLSRYVDAIMLRTDQGEKLRELARACQRAGDQRPDRPHPSLPADGRRDDRRGASRADRRQDRGVERRRQQHGDVAGSMPPCSSASSCGSPARSS